VTAVCTENPIGDDFGLGNLNSLFLRRNSLFCRNNSLFFCVGGIVIGIKVGHLRNFGLYSFNFRIKIGNKIFPVSAI
jgi:hypothetical protein